MQWSEGYVSTTSRHCCIICRRGSMDFSSVGSRPYMYTLPPRPHTQNVIRTRESEVLSTINVLNIQNGVH